MEIYENKEHWNRIQRLVERGSIVEDRFFSSNQNDWTYHATEMDEMNEEYQSILKALGGESPGVIAARWAGAVDKLKQAKVYPYNTVKC